MKQILDENSLKGDQWLLAYEAEYNGWLVIRNIATCPVFKEIKMQKVNFYDASLPAHRSIVVAKKKGTAAKVMGLKIELKTALIRAPVLVEEY